MALGWPSVAWGLSNISGRELSEWKAFYKFEPFGREREDFRVAYQTSWIVNTLIGLLGGKKSKSVPFEKFMISFREQKRGLNTEELSRKVKMLNEYFGGKDLRKKK